MKSFKSYLQNKDVRILLENFISLSALKVLTYILPMISLPYLSRVIGVEKFGMIAFAASIIVFFQTFVDYGFNFTGIRDISRNRDCPKKINEVFSAILSIRLIFTLISFILLFILLYTVKSLAEYRVLMLYSFLVVPGDVLFPEWFFQAFEKMKYVTIFNIISRLLFTILIFVFIKQESDYIYVPLLTSLGSLFAGVFALYIIVKKFNVIFVLPSFKMMISYIRASFNMFISLIFPNLYTNISTVLIESIWGKASTGIFSAAYKIVGITSSISDVLSRVFYPYLARRMDKHTVYVKLTFTINLIFSLLLYFFADSIIFLLYGSAFDKAAVIVKIMSITPMFLFLMNTYGTNYLVLVNREDILRKIVISVSVLGCLIGSVLIYYFSYIGAAISITTVWGIRGGITYYLASRIKKNGNK